MRLRKRKSTSAVGSIPLTRLLGTRYSPLLLILLSLTLIFTTTFDDSMTRGVRTRVTDVVAPVLDTVSRPFQAAGQMFGGMTDITTVREENARLQLENQRLRQWYEAALRLEAENKSLKGLLNVVREPGWSYMTARVIADPGRAFVRSLLIAAGSNDGVARGQAAMTGDGLVGRVIETGKNSARILLITDLNSRVPVVIESNNQRAILAGDNTAKPFLEHLPRDTGVEMGARVVTSGHGGLLPPGLPVGRVVSVKDGEIRVAPLADFNRVGHVQLVDFRPDPAIRSGVLLPPENDGEAER